MQQVREIPGRSQGQRGLTLLEVVVVLGIMGIVVAIILVLHTMMSKSSLTVKRATELQRQVKMGAMYLERHLESAGFNLPAGSNTFTTMDSVSIAFSYVDVLKRHCGNPEELSVKYSVQNGNTLRQELKCKSGESFSKDVITANDALALNLKYFDINGNETSLSSEVKVVRYEISVLQKSKERVLKDRKVEGEVQIKNN